MFDPQSLLTPPQLLYLFPVGEVNEHQCILNICTVYNETFKKAAAIFYWVFLCGNDMTAHLMEIVCCFV